MPWYIYLALKQLFPTGRFLSFFALVSIIGVSLGVAVLLIVQSVMNGFGEQYREKIIGTSGDIRIEAGQIIADWKSISELIEPDDGVIASTPYAQGMVMLQYRNIPVFPMIRGIDPVREGKVTKTEEYFIYGTMDDLHDESLFLSQGLARKIGVTAGDVVQLYTPLMLERMTKDEVLFPREMEVAGIYKTGWEKFDSNTVICTLRTMQDLYALDDGVHGVSVKIKSDEKTLSVARRLNEKLQPPLRAYTWMETFEDFLYVLRLEKTVMFFIMIFIILVASFSIAIALMMAVLRKTREIGLLIALGASPSQVAMSYCFQGSLIGIVGTVLGIGFAFLVLENRGGIIRTLVNWTQGQDAMLHYYGFADIPVHYSSTDFVITIIFSFVISTLAGLLPAMKAARLKPAEALRSE